MSGEGDLFVGIDLGTQGVRALVADIEGTVLGAGAAPVPDDRHDDAHEQSAQSWWDAAAIACRQAVARIAAERITAVATCGTSGTIVLVDADGEPVTQALMYDDGRAAPQARRLGMATSWALPKLHWFLEHEPATRRPAVRVAHQPDIVTSRLVGHPVATDASHALKTGYDAGRGCFEDHGSEDVRHLLPGVVAPGTQLGEVSAQATAQTGLPSGAAVIAGMTDGCAAQIAAGALRPGDWNSVLGTTLVLKGCSDERIDDPTHGVYSHRSPDGGWLPGGASSSGAGVLPQRFPGRDLDELGRRAADHEQTRVLAYPLVSRGERFPFAAPAAEGFMLGTPADEGEHAAALMQGVALVERLCFDALGQLGAPLAGELTLTGGATRNRAWSQLRADALNRPVRLPERAESAFGMAILAAAAARGEPVAGAAARMSHTREVIDPRASPRAHLDEQYARLIDELERRGWLISARC
ncbi:MAG TPA: FGGY-family carbohydrate kinase [Solirubrobacteraceae bacterium]|nr:FGGY-family carbohydrate kinase [Solirubrobacteraceae bacterium]